MKIKRFLPLFQALFVALICFFLGRSVLRHWRDIQELGQEANYLYLSASLLISMVVFWLFSFSWKKLVDLLGEELSSTNAFKIKAVSNMAHYVPGGIWNHAGKLVLAKKQGLRGKPVFLSIILNIVFTLISACVIFLFSLIFFNGYTALNGYLQFIPVILVILLIVCYCLTSPSILESLINYLLPKIGKRRIELKFSREAIIKCFLWYFLYWLVQGIAFFFVIQAFLPVEISKLFSVIGIYAISWSVGFLMILAPSGAGVREASLIILLSAIVPKPVAIGSALIFRFIIVLRDIIAFFIAKRV